MPSPVGFLNLLKKSASNPAWLKAKIAERAIRSPDEAVEMQNLSKWLSEQETKTGPIDPETAFLLQRNVEKLPRRSLPQEESFQERLPGFRKGGLVQLFSQHPGNRRVGLPESEPWMNSIEAISSEMGLNPLQAKALLFAESAGGYKTSSAGAQGPWQLMPMHTKQIDPNNPEQATRAALTMYKRLLDQYKSPEAAAAAYNLRPQTMNNALQKGAMDFSKLPKETAYHVSRFNEYLDQ